MSSGADAFGAAVDELIANCGGEYASDVEFADRARVLALYAAAVAEAEARGRAAAEAALAEALGVLLHSYHRWPRDVGEIVMAHFRAAMNGRAAALRNEADE